MDVCPSKNGVPAFLDRAYQRRCIGVKGVEMSDRIYFSEFIEPSVKVGAVWECDLSVR